MATIRLNKQSKTIKVVNRKDTIRLKKQELKIKLEHTGKVGPTGADGPKGDTGYGIPAGGNTNQVLKKKSNADYDFEWVAPTFEDRYYATSFTVADTVLVDHNLGKYPAVTVIDSAGDEVVGQVEHLSTMQARVLFSAPFSGQITCN